MLITDPVLFLSCLAVIPLAKKLKECGVFGVASDEYLSYAIANRQEWEARGEDIVKEMANKTKNAKSTVFVELNLNK